MPCVLSHFSCVWLFVIPWTVVCQATWDSPGKDTRVSCHFLLQGIFLTQGLNLCLLCFLHWQAGSLSPAPPGKARLMQIVRLLVLIPRSVPLMAYPCNAESKWTLKAGGVIWLLFGEAKSKISDLWGQASLWIMVPALSVSKGCCCHQATTGTPDSEPRGNSGWRQTGCPAWCQALSSCSHHPRMHPEETQDEKAQGTFWPQIAEVHIKGVISVSLDSYTPYTEKH